MFNFKRLLIVFKTNWKNVINETLPKGNKWELSLNDSHDILTGIVLIFISSIICPFFDTDLISLILSIIRLLICVSLFAILNIYKKSKINSGVIFVLFIISSLNMLSSFITSIIYIPMIFVKLYLIVLVILNLINSLGFAFLVAAFIDFLKGAREQFEIDNRVDVKQDIKLKTININDISIHSIKKCDNCNCNILESDVFCSNCGKKLK